MSFLAIAGEVARMELNLKNILIIGLIAIASVEVAGLVRKKVKA